MFSEDFGSSRGKKPRYRLVAVVYHDGKDLGEGHYTTAVYHPGYMYWILYDDAIIEPISKEELVYPIYTRVPYLLFYERQGSSVSNSFSFKRRLGDGNDGLEKRGKKTKLDRAAGSLDFTSDDFTNLW